MAPRPAAVQGAKTGHNQEPEDGSIHIPTIALAGNPNTGKSTLFNGMTGLRQHIANYPGITVDLSTGFADIGGQRYRIVDLPGTYSLHSRKPDERIAVRSLFGTIGAGHPGQTGDSGPAKTGMNNKMPEADELSPPDLILNIVDSSNPDRNLFLTTQLMDTGIPMLVVLNMADLAREKGIDPDPERLERKLGVPVVSVSATERSAAGLIRDAIAGERFARPKPLGWRPEKALRKAVEHLVEHWVRPHSGLPAAAHIPEALRLISDEHPGTPFHDTLPPPGMQKVLEKAVDEARSIIRQAGGNPVAIEVLNRYEFIGGCTSGNATKTATASATATANANAKANTGATIPIADRIDTMVTHRILGPIFFALVLMLVFQSIFTWAEPFMDLIDLVFISSGMWLSANLPPGILTDVLVDGVLAGLGGVIIFLPQILFLFFFIHLLEGSGYMARAAFVMDRFMARLGMHGRSVVPLVSGFACAVPGIMATRSIESARDRFITIMVLPFMTCSARLPVYALLIAAFIPPTVVLGFLNLQGVVFFGLYMFGILTAVLAALVLNRMLPKEKHRPFVMELPDYRMPDWRTVLSNTFDRGRVFVVEAGRIIIAISIVLWFLASYPKTDVLPHIQGGDVALVEEEVEEEIEVDIDVDVDVEMGMEMEAEPGTGAEAGESAGGRELRNSYAGRIGRFIEPAIEPLGFDWKIGIGLITSFAAREVIVGTLNTIYSIQADNGSEEPLRQKLIGDTHPETGQPVYTIATALSLMVFFALAMQCMATIAVVRRETGTWKWPLVMFLGMTALAWVCSFVVYQVAGLLLG
jgi:ferrous iron transport protein B